MGNNSRPKTITWNGETKTLTEWAKVAGMSYQTLHQRLRLGYSVGDALTEAKCAPGRRRDGKRTMTSDTLKEWLKANEACGCEECTAVRLRAVRTDAERSVRWKLETAARIAARQRQREEW